MVVPIVGATILYFLVFKKPLVTCLQYISIAFNLAFSKGKLYKTLDYWSSDMLVIYWFFRIGSGNSFSTKFVYNFSRKMFLMLYSISWPSFIWLSLLLEILGNMCIASQAVMTQTLKLTCLSNQVVFFTWSKRSRQIEVKGWRKEQKELSF